MVRYDAIRNEVVYVIWDVWYGIVRHGMYGTLNVIGNGMIRYGAIRNVWYGMCMWNVWYGMVYVECMVRYIDREWNDTVWCDREWNGTVEWSRIG